MSYHDILKPLDEHNRLLESQVRPPDYENPKPAERYHLVVIGAGTAGLVTAAGAAGLGAKVALVERGLMGGDCLNVGCVPSKALISSARAAAAVREAGAFGVRVPGGVEVDFGAAMERMRRLRGRISHHDSVRRFSRMGIDVFLGQASFLDRSTVAVGDCKLKFKKAVIATGSRAAVPHIPGLEEVDTLTNETLFSLTQLPKDLAVIGAGPIGCEMVQVFARFGSKVHLIESMPGILPQEDRLAAKLVAERFEKDGVEILCGVRDLRLSPEPGGGVRIAVESEGRGRSLRVEKLLVAVGRTPNLEGLDLEKAGVDFHAKGVVVDDRLRTTNPKVYAAGDVCSPYQFTHAADFMARIVIRNALFLGRARASRLVIPWCTYTTPEIAHVGLTPERAAERGIEIDTYTQEFSGVDRAILEGEEDGLVRVHVKRGGDVILGGTIVAARAGDMIGTLVTAMTRGIGLGSLAQVIHPYPTQGEALRKVGDLYQRTRLTPRVKGLFERWLRWTS